MSNDNDLRAYEVERLNNELSELENDRLNLIKDLELLEFTLSAIDATLVRLDEYLKPPKSKPYVESIIIRSLYLLKGETMDRITETQESLNYIDELLNCSDDED